MWNPPHFIPTPSPHLPEHTAFGYCELEQRSLMQNLTMARTPHQQPLHNAYMNLHKQDTNVERTLRRGQKIGPWD